MFESKRIARPFGINLYVHGTFWLLPALVLFTGILGAGLPAAMLDVSVILGLFGCIALHELGHALAARKFGIRTLDIVLYPIGGVARLERMPRHPWQEIVVALAGPAVNVAIILFLAPLMWLDGMNLVPLAASSSPWELFWNRLLWGNAFLVVFNMIPAFPMDGGRVFRALLASVMDRLTATRIAANVGAVFAILFGLWGILGGGHLMLVILAFFLFMAGRAELAAVEMEARRGEHSARRSHDPWGEPEIPVARPASGWEYDARQRVWVFWQNGRPVRVVSPP